MINEFVNTMVECIMEFEELNSKECVGVFVSGKNTLEIWKCDNATHLRLFHSGNHFGEFIIPNNKLKLVIDKLNLKEK